MRYIPYLSDLAIYRNGELEKLNEIDLYCFVQMARLGLESLLFHSTEGM